jgi:hypothetical protein
VLVTAAREIGGLAVPLLPLRRLGLAAQPKVEIVLEPPGANPNAPPAGRQVITELMAKGLISRIVFATDDCDATFSRIQASGADVVQEPTDQPYGVRDCGFRDPAGNLLRFSQSR